MRNLVITIVLSLAVSGILSAEETTIGAILANPKENEGRLLELSGTVGEVRPMTAAGYYFFQLADDSGSTITVRTTRRGRVAGETYLLKGRLRSDPLQGRYIIVEEEFILGSKPPATPDAALPQPDAQASGTADPDVPAMLDSPPDSIEVELVGNALNEPVIPVAPHAAPQVQSLLGDYGFIFEKASASVKDMLVSEIGRLAISVLHPTCTFSGNQLESNYNLGTAGRAVFRTAYNGLLIGDREMRWEVVFDGNGMLSDVRLISDSSPLTNVTLINTVKDRVFQYIKQQINQFTK